MLKLDGYLRIGEAAEYLGVCRNTLRNWELADKLPVHRHPANNYRLFKIVDLDKILHDAERSVTRRRNRKPR
jgi:MerR family transcriptional regulator, copper efflux regulator